MVCAAEKAEKDVVFTYPGWKLKALSFSYDDGNIADRKLVEIFNKYKMKATFHIPSAWLKAKPKNRITEAEIETLYKGHEIAGHGASHFRLATLKSSEVDAEIKSDIAEWKRITGKNITGYAYPFGSYSPEVITVLRQNGLIYSRTVGKETTFALPKDFLVWTPSSHHNGNIAELGEKYLKFYPEKMSILLIWGHSYEFPRKNNWHVIENFCRQMSFKDDIFYATMGEIADYVSACRQAEFSPDGKSLKNTSARQLFLLVDGQKVTIAPNSEYKFK
jgi:peptidoglycan/xylan/chitin deacetylase (PgdA/CDA1 family)